MLSLHRRHGGRDRGRHGDLSRDGRTEPEEFAGAEGADLDAVDPPTRADVPVVLSPGLAELAVPLTNALGPPFRVLSDGSVNTGVMIVGPLGPVGIAFLRASHPGVVLLVVDRRWSSSQPNEAVAHLEAGADGYLASPMVAEVASHVRALARRAGLWPDLAWAAAAQERSPIPAA
jgi:hypothetical protein